jgi:hypothetical protein
MKGKTILEIIQGEDDDWDDAVIIKMTDGTIYYIKSGSGSSHGMLDIKEVPEIPKTFKSKEDETKTS